MNLFSAYELYEEFTLHDVSYLLDGHQPLPPGFPPDNDAHKIMWHRAKMLASQLMNDASTGKLRAIKQDSGRWDLAGCAAEWVVKRKDLRDWAKQKMIRPDFLFPELPPLDTVHNVASAEAGVGRQSKVLTWKYKRVLLDIAQQINKGQLVAYVPDSGGEFAKLQGEDSLVFQMRSFLAEGVKSEERLQARHQNGLTGERTAAGNIIPANMDWTERIHIPADVASANKLPAQPQTIRPAKQSSREAKQDGSIGRDILASVIEKAIEEAGSKEWQPVFLLLRESALNSEPPFTGEIDGDALCYTNSENKPDKLTKSALSKRLQRRRAAECG